MMYSNISRPNVTMSSRSTIPSIETSTWRPPFSVSRLPLVVVVLVIVVHIATASDAGANSTISKRLSRRAQLSYQLTEELPSGTVVADDLISDAGLGSAADTGSGRYSATAGSTRRRTVGLVLLESEHSERFRLESDGRRLVTTEVVDREACCQQQATCRFDVDLAVPSSSSFEVMFVVKSVELDAEMRFKSTGSVFGYFAL